MIFGTLNGKTAYKLAVMPSILLVFYMVYKQNVGSKSKYQKENMDPPTPPHALLAVVRLWGNAYAMHKHATHSLSTIVLSLPIPQYRLVKIASYKIWT